MNQRYVVEKYTNKFSTNFRFYLILNASCGIIVVANNLQEASDVP